MGGSTRARGAIIPLLLITGVSLGIKLVYMPIATASSADRTIRTWRAWTWLEDPELITHGLWGPLHYYLIAGMLALGVDPVPAPVVLNLLFEAFTPWLLYAFAVREFGSRRAALLVALSYALYPIAIFNTLGGMVQPVFTFFLALALLLVSIARQDGGTWKHAAAAGLALTLAGMLRYEGWMLIPLLGVLLWRKPRLAALFVTTAMLFPLFWMIGNGIHYGDPLYSMTSGSRWKREMMGRARSNIAARIGVIPGFLASAVRWMTLPAAIAALTGAAITIVKRNRAVVWLVPPAGLLCIFCIALVRGSLPPKIEYTSTLGFLLLTFGAACYKAIGVDSRTPWRVGAAGVVVVSMLAFSYAGLPQVLPFSVHPVPVVGRGHVEPLAAALREHLRPADGFVTDFYDWVPTHYTALLTRHHPDAIYRAPGAPYDEVRIDELAGFLDEHPEGVLLLHTQSRFAAALSPSPEGELQIGDRVVSLRRVWSTPWKKLPRSPLRVSDDEPAIVVYRYETRDRRDARTDVTRRGVQSSRDSLGRRRR